MYCKLLKLTNGEDIMVSTEDSCANLEDKKFIEVTDPVAIQTVRMPYKGMMVESYIMQPWMKMVVGGAYKISASSIVVVADVLAKAETQYKSFIENYNSNGGNSIATDDELPTEDDVLDAYFDYDGSEEDDDDDNSRPDSSSRTYH